MRTAQIGPDLRLALTQIHPHVESELFVLRDLPQETRRFYLDSNLAKFDTLAKSKGFKLTHYVDGLSETTFDRIKDWQNVLPSRLQADGKNLAEKGRDLIEDVRSTTEYEWDGYHCFIGIRNSHAVLYFIPIESRETPYNTTGWHEYSSSFEVDVIRMHLAFLADDSSRYAAISVR